MLDAFIRYALWPLMLLGCSWGFVAGFQADRALLALVSVPTVAVLVLIGLERIRPRDRLSSWNDPQWLNDIAHNTLGGLLGPMLGNLLFVGSAVAVAAAVGDRFEGNLWPARWPIALQVVLAIVLSDGLEYWRHRLLHRVGWLWPTHALHHGSDRLHTLKSGRGHVVDFASRGLFVVAPLVAVGAPPELLLAYPAAMTVVGPVSHSNLDIRLPDWLHYLVSTPPVHEIHHARAHDLADSNFAPTLPFWDVLFGTFTHPRVLAGSHPAIGIEDGPLPGGFWRQLLVPFRPLRGAQPVAGLGALEQ